jgi:hypothetical protein
MNGCRAGVLTWDPVKTQALDHFTFAIGGCINGYSLFFVWMTDGNKGCRTLSCIGWNALFVGDSDFILLNTIFLYYFVAFSNYCPIFAQYNTSK